MMESKYRPSYVSHYKQTGSPLNIDEYTRLWGSKLMPEKMIYRPVTVTVALNPDVAYKLQVDPTRSEWRKELCDGVREMMGAKVSTNMTLRDDMGRDIKDIPVSRIFHVGRLYPHGLSGDVYRRAMTKRAKLGQPMDVPIGLSINKKAHFDEWINDVQNKVVNSVSASLAECKTPKQVGQRLMLDDRDSIKQLIHKEMAPRFKEMLDVHSSARDVDARDLVDHVSEFVMAAIKDGLIKNKTKVQDWFEADRHEKRDSAKGAGISADINPFEIGDSISANSSKLKREYPHSRLLFQELVGAALYKNQIGKHVYYIVLRGGKKHRKRRRHCHKKGKKPVVVMASQKKIYERHPGRSYKMYAEGDKSTYMRTLFKSHDMKGLRNYPGTLPYGDQVRGSVEVSSGRNKSQVGNPYGLSSVTSCDAPSLESVGDEVPSIESVYPGDRNFGSKNDEVPSIEPMFGNPHGLKSVQKSERSANPHGLQSVNAELDDDSLEAIDSPPALESVGSEVDDEDSMDSMEMLDEDQEEVGAPMLKKRSTKKSAPVEANVFDEVSLSSPASYGGGLPSLSAFKQEYGLVSEDIKAAMTKSGVHGKTYSKDQDEPIYGNAMKIMGHYYVLRHGRTHKKHHRRGRHGRRRRVVVLTANNKVFGRIQAQEITELKDPIDVEEYVEPFIASSYQDESGTISFTTSDGRLHKIRDDGTYFVNGRQQPLPVEKVVEQDLSGEPVLLVLHQNKA